MDPNRKTIGYETPERFGAVSEPAVHVSSIAALLLSIIAWPGFVFLFGTDVLTERAQQILVIVAPTVSLVWTIGTYAYLRDEAKGPLGVADRRLIGTSSTLGVLWLLWGAAAAFSMWVFQGFIIR